MISTDDIGVRFYEETDSGDTVWEDYGEFSINDIHRQVTIAIKTFFVKWPYKWHSFSVSEYIHVYSTHLQVTVEIVCSMLQVAPKMD